MPRTSITALRRTVRIETGLLAVLLLAAALSISGTARAAASIQNCNLFKYGDRLDQVAFHALDTARRSIAVDSKKLKNLTPQAHEAGLITEVPDCRGAAVRLYGNMTNYSLELRYLNSDTCRALQSSPFLKAKGVEVMVFNSETKKRGPCWGNSIAENLPLVGHKMPGPNMVSLVVPSLRTWSDLGCTRLEKSKYTKERRRVEQALDIIRRNGTWSPDHLDDFERRDGYFRLCRDGYTAFHDFTYRIDIGIKQLAGWDDPTLIRVLLEEIAHANRTTRGWPDPRRYGSRSRFAEDNGDALLNMEAEGWVRAWLDSEMISKKSGIRVPLMPMTKAYCRKATGGRQLVSEFVDNLKRVLRDPEPGNKFSDDEINIIVAKHCVKDYIADQESDGTDKTYEKYYRDMSGTIYDCSRSGRLEVRRGRPMCDETIR